MAATDPSGELATHELAEMLAGHFPQVSERTGRHYSCNDISSLHDEISIMSIQMVTSLHLNLWVIVCEKSCLTSVARSRLQKEEAQLRTTPRLRR